MTPDIIAEIKLLEELINQRVDGLKCWRHHRNTENPPCERCWYCQVGKLNIDNLVATISNMQQDNERLLAENKTLNERLKYIVDECSQSLSVINNFAGH